jgi:transaldolase
VPPVFSLNVKLFLDGADIGAIQGLGKQAFIRGFTTNPSLMRKAGVTDYLSFAREAARLAGDKPISFEVFSDDFPSMEKEARILRGIGENVYVKIPVTNTESKSAADLVHKLSTEGIPLNVTAVFTLDQVREIGAALSPTTRSIVSVFAGRIADTGIDPVPVMSECVAILRNRPAAELLWASPRELLNVFQADACGCHIITATADILGKLDLVGKDHAGYSLETVKMFYKDAQAAGYRLID